MDIISGIMSEELKDRREACLDELRFLSEQLETAANSERELYLLLRQSRIIELGAIEKYLGMAQSRPSKSANRRQYHQRWSNQNH